MGWRVGDKMEEPPRTPCRQNDYEGWHEANKKPYSYNEDGSVATWILPGYGGPYLCPHLTPETSSGYSPCGSETYFEQCDWCDEKLNRLIDKVLDAENTGE